MLVASYIGYEAPSLAEEDDETDAGAPTWLGPGRALRAPAELTNAQTPADALAAAERMFFGDVKDVRDL